MSICELQVNYTSSFPTLDTLESIVSKVPSELIFFFFRILPKSRNIENFQVHHFKLVSHCGCRFHS